MRIWKDAGEESKTSRMLLEAMKLATAMSGTPVANALELKLNVAAYLTLLWTLFGDTCHQYQKPLQIYHILQLLAVMAAKQVYTPLLCR